MIWEADLFPFSLVSQESSLNQVPQCGSGPTKLEDLNADDSQRTLHNHMRARPATFG